MRAFIRVTRFLVPIVLGLAVCVSVRAQGPATTRITDTIYQPDGTSLFSGILRISNPLFISADGYQIAARIQVVSVTNGALSVALVPTEGVTPAYAVYTVIYTGQNPPAQQQLWNVPASGAALKINQVIFNAANYFPVLDPLTATGVVTPGDCAVWSTSSTLKDNGPCPTPSFPNQSANFVFAGPSSGPSATPAFRALTGADLPLPSTSSIGGVEAVNAISHEWISSISSSGIPSLSQPSFADILGQLQTSQFPAGNSCPANQFADSLGPGFSLGCAQPAFSNLSGTIALAQFGSQAANTFLAVPNGAPGNPVFRVIVAADVPTTLNATTFPNITDSSLTVGDCIQAGTGGLLQSASAPCGSGSGGANAGAPNFGQAFSSATTVSIPETATTLDTKNLIVQCYDNGLPANAIQPLGWTVDSSFNVTVNFATPQSGYCVVNGSGPAFYTTAEGTATTWSIPESSHGLGKYVQVAAYDTGGTLLTPGMVLVDASGNVTISWAVAQAGRVVLTQ